MTNCLRELRRPNKRYKITDSRLRKGLRWEVVPVFPVFQGFPPIFRCSMSSKYTYSTAHIYDQHTRFSGFQLGISVRICVDIIQWRPLIYRKGKTLPELHANNSLCATEYWKEWCWAASKRMRSSQIVKIAVKICSILISFVRHFSGLTRSAAERNRFWEINLFTGRNTWRMH